MTFFATPHRGSPDLFRPQSTTRIQKLLGLSKPLPTGGGSGLLRLNSDVLLNVDVEFREISSDIHIWTLYETGSYQNSESLAYVHTDAQIKAPLISMRSAILGIRHEIIYPLRGSHANCASFGMNNLRTMRLYIRELGNTIRKSNAFHENNPGGSLDLEQRVSIQVHEFYEVNASSQSATRNRVYSTERTIKDFLVEGLDARHEMTVGSDTQTIQNIPHFGSPDTITSIASDHREAGQSSTVLEIAVDMATLSRPEEPHNYWKGLSNQQRGPLQRPFSLPKSLHSDGNTSRESSHSADQRRTPLRRTQYPIRPFFWAHQRFNNPTWVVRVLETLALKDQLGIKPSGMLSAKHWIAMQEGGRHSQPHAWYLKPSCDFWHRDSFDVPLSGGVIGKLSHGCIYLCMPFLHFDTYKAIVERRRLISRRLFHGLRKPVPVDILREPSLELKAIWDYLDHDPPINIRRTLDQFQYPSLDTKARDDDQVLYKMTKERFETFDLTGGMSIPLRLQW